MENKKFKVAQSIIEYICVTAVFAGVSMAGFALFVQNSALSYRGQVATYRNPATLDGNILNDGVSNSEYAWPTTWDESQSKFNNEVPSSFVNNPDANNLPVPNDPELDAKIREMRDKYPTED
ncbi:MAG: hypothetical protein PHP17_05350 [Candidatus Omnitrophica bacterium]|nr:hypothetical protein [Candidatus Omnitrophota bacterium]